MKLVNMFTVKAMMNVYSLTSATTSVAFAYCKRVCMYVFDNIDILTSFVYIYTAYTNNDNKVIVRRC